MQQPMESTQPGTSGGGSGYGTKGDDQKSQYESSKRSDDNSRYIPMVLKGMTTKTIVPEPTVRAPNSRAGIKEPLNKTRGCQQRRDDSFADEPGERRGSE